MKADKIPKYETVFVKLRTIYASESLIKKFQFITQFLFSAGSISETLEGKFKNNIILRTPVRYE